MAAATIPSSASKAASAYPLVRVRGSSGIDNSAPDEAVPGVRRKTRTGRPLASRSTMNPEELSRESVLVTLNASAVGTAAGSNSFRGWAVSDPLTDLANCATSAGDKDRLTTTQPRGEADGACPLTGRAMIHRASAKVASWDGRLAASD